uniref:Uncharacterized protein MANES_10G116200 n=1 Tax=Rhizophora mucronata TaxID=61149 RepID=A0A2P2K7T5_RHIMU
MVLTPAFLNSVRASWSFHFDHSKNFQFHFSFLFCQESLTHLIPKMQQRLIPIPRITAILGPRLSS